METWDAIRARRDVRDYEERTLLPEELDRILEAARRSPSSQNQQRWDFVVVTDEERLGRLAQVWKGASHVARSAATVALVAPVTDEPASWASINYDLGQATMCLMLAAADLGIGSAHAAVEDHDLAREILGLPGDRTVAYLVPLGYPADGPLEPVDAPDRRPFDDVVHRGQW